MTDKILIVGPAWVGDMVMTHTLIQCIKQKKPAAQIDVLSPPWTLSLLSHMPEVSRAIEIAVPHGTFDFSTRRSIAHTLHAENYTQSIVIPNSWKSALIPFLAHIPHRTGWLGEMRLGLLNDIRLLNQKKYPMMIQRVAALGFERNAMLPIKLPNPQLFVKPQQAEAVMQKFSVDKKNKILILCPGAEYGPAKQWSVYHFVTVAEKKLKEGWAVWLLGSAKDVSITQKIQSLCNEQCRDFAGRTTLSEAVALISLADIVLTNDSGLMHIASALNKKTIALFGSSSPIFTPPLGEKTTVLSLSLSCSPCFKRECPFQHVKCLTDLSPQLVLPHLVV